MRHHSRIAVFARPMLLAVLLGLLFLPEPGYGVAPTNSVPGVQTIKENNNVVFSSANGNAISVSDSDAGANPLEVTLSVTNGSLTLSGTAGLSFTVGNGTANSTMTFHGTTANINTALNGLIFSPTPNYSGSAALTIKTIDNLLVSLNLDNALVGHYTFENTGSLGLDTSPAGANSGTVTGATANVDGTRGNVLNLNAADGAADYVQVTGHFGNPANVTLAAWANLTLADSAGADVISLGDNVAIRLDSSGRLKGFIFDNGSAYKFAEYNTLIAGTGWHHVAFTFDDAGNVARTYLDGSVVASATINTSIGYTLGANSFIGTHGNGVTNTDFTGKIDDARVYNRALTGAEITTLATDLSLMPSNSVAITINALNISGTVFEDVNYGGGAGRDKTATGSFVRSGARVELFDNSGNYVAFATTNGSGAYTFSGLDAGTYTVRVVNNSVTSSRTGYAAGLLPVQTYRTDASSGTAVSVTDHVGGEVPVKADAGNGSTTLAALTTASFAPQSITTVVLGAADISGVDYGYSFDVVVNTNDSGQGSLRQFITNANTLGGDATLAQSGLVASKENAVFMISNGTAAAGLRSTNNYFSSGAATITPTSVLPNISTPMVIDAQKQPGWTAAPIIELNGAGAGAGVSGVTVSAGSSTIKGFVINRFINYGIYISASGSNAIAGNYVGVNSAGTAAAANGAHGIYILGTGGNTISGNVISGNSSHGLFISGAANNNNFVWGNFIGTSSDGSAALGNVFNGIEILNSTTGNIIGTNGDGSNDSAERNIISANGGDDISVQTASGTIIAGNYIGLNAAGTAMLGTTSIGIDLFQSANNNRIGTDGNGISDVLERNIIAGADTGIRLYNNSTGNVIAGNYIGTNALGTGSIGNVSDGIFNYNSSNNTIGGTSAVLANIIANTSSGPGVNIISAASGNAILGNSIYNNSGLGIDLANNGVTLNDGAKTAGQPNLLMDFPVFTSTSLNGATLTVSGYVGSAANQATFAGARVEVFKSDNDGSGYGEGQTYLGFLTTNASGNFSGSLDVTGKGLNAGDRVTGTATDAGNNTSEFGANATVVGFADLALTLTDNPDPAAAGGDLLYSMLITNNGPNMANNVTLTNVLPAGVILVSATPSQGSCSGTTTITCSLGSMANSATANIDILVVTSSTGTITDSATVAATETDSVPANNSATVSTSVVAGITTRIPLTMYRRIHGFVDSIVTGGSLRTASNRVNACAVGASSTAALSGIPASATVVGAYLYWGGSGSTADNQVSLDGASMTADRTFTARYVLGSNNYDYFGGFKDVTAQVQAKRNGNYTFSGLTVDTANPYCSSQAVLAGWSMFVIYSDNSASGKTIVVYDGFDIRRNDSTSYNLTGIFAATPPEAKTTVLVWEGDEDLSGGGENLQFNGSTLSDALNPANNVYNSTINTLGSSTSYGVDLDTFDVSSHVQPRATLATMTVSVGADLVILNAVLLQVKSNIITGTVFEDVNYGGGAGRDLATATAAASGFTVTRPGATVELYDSTGVLIRTTTTDSNGLYGFAGLADGDYTVRAVDSSVTSSRPGSTGNERGVQTFRTDATTGTAVAVTNEVGGLSPNLQDAPANSTNANLAGIVAQSKAPTKVITGIAVTGVDFGFNFDTIVNTNDSGQGSLRQFLANANAFGNIGLAQSGRASGIDNAVWMISNGTAAAGLRLANNYFSSGIATIGMVSALPTVSDPVVIDGSTQPGWTGPQIIKLTGAGAGGGANGLTVSGGNSTIRELIIDSFGGAGISLSGTGGSIVSDNIIHANNRGIYDNAASDQFFRNVIYGNSGANGEGIYLDSGASGVKIYQNTVHGNSTRGISQAGGSATIRNNLITGSGGVGLFSSGGTLTESYNGITDAVTTPANTGGRSNLVLSGTDLNINPLYAGAASGNFSLTECTSPAINQGTDLGNDQPDMNGAAAGLWNNNAPDLGALESGSSCTPSLSIVKQAWDLNGTVPLASLTAPVGSTIAFLIYVKNTTAGPVTDLRINDALDETAFQYITGSLVRTSAATPPADSATDLAIFTATAPGNGTVLSDGVDGDVASAMDTGGPVGIDRITIGTVASQANAGLTLSAHTIFGLRFKVKIK